MKITITIADIHVVLLLSGVALFGAAIAAYLCGAPSVASRCGMGMVCIAIVGLILGRVEEQTQ